MKPDELDKEALRLAAAHIGKSLHSAETYRKDVVSHHILRLAFCSSEDKRRQFLASETALFKARLAALPPREVRRRRTSRDARARARTHPRARRPRRRPSSRSATALRSRR